MQTNKKLVNYSKPVVVVVCSFCWKRSLKKLLIFSILCIIGFLSRHFPDSSCGAKHRQQIVQTSFGVSKFKHCTVVVPLVKKGILLSLPVLHQQKIHMTDIN